MSDDRKDQLIELAWFWLKVILIVLAFMLGWWIGNNT